MNAAASALKLLALGPNPAYQKVMTFDGPIKPGAVHRAASVNAYVGGKGQGVAMALSRWAPERATVAHFLGGDTGKYVEEQCAAAGLEQIVQHVAAPTRVCTTLLPEVTELIDPSGDISEEELAGFLDKILAYCAATSIGGMALCGTTPPGAASLYANLAELLLKLDASGEAGPPPLLLLDGFKNIDAVLQSGRVDVLKINVDEVLALTGEATAEAAAAKARPRQSNR